MQQLLFPFEKMRSVQESMIKDIANAVDKQKHIVVHAPTGIGKSAASISPTLTYAIKNNKTVIFLTPRHTQHRIVVETLRQIKDKFGTNIVATDFIGKRWMCLVPGVNTLRSNDFNEYCRESRKQGRCSFYNNVWKDNKLTVDAKEVVSKLKESSPMHVEGVIAASAREKMCPYFISSELAKESNFIIADYYHLFHPSVRKAFLLRIKKEIEDCIIIVDEAQNLPGRIRDVLSSKISNFSISVAVNEARKIENLEIAADIEAIREVLYELSLDLRESKERYVDREDFVQRLSEKTGRNYEELAGDLILIGEQIRTEDKRSFIGSIGSFLERWIDDSEGYVRILKLSRWKDKEQIELNLSCLDPSVSSKELFDSCHSAILMSGTLTPTQMYRDLLGMEKKRTLCKEYPSQFPKTNQLSLIVPDTTTKFTRRRKEEYEKIAEWCASIANAVKGNVAVFFPSYYLRDEVFRYFERKSAKTIFMEKPGMSKEEKSDFFKQFKSYSDVGAVFFGVIGGSFGEGVDLPGKFLNGAIIVGIPLESPDLKTKALINYYDKTLGAGWNYGYVYPAMNKIIQACGRVIRSEKDKGVVVLLDERFVWKNYFKMLPSDWNLVVTKEPVRRIKEFF